VSLKSSPKAPFSADALGAVLARLGLTPDTPLMVAYSGGLDSHVLLHALCALRRDAPWRVRAVHIDHGLQAASASWARHCEHVCAGLQVAYAAERVAVTAIDDEGLEAAARRARYTCLVRHMAPGDALLTAHHQDDQAETLLLQLLRGAGIRGMAAMGAQNTFGAGRHARPLLEFPRAALLAYARAHDLAWIEDASNLDTGIARNFLRQRVMPVLAERWPQVAATLARSARHAAEAAAMLDAVAAADLDGAGGGAPDTLRVSALLPLPMARRRHALRLWLRRLRLPTPSDSQLAELLRHVQIEPATHHAAVHWPGATVYRYRDCLSAAAAGPQPLSWAPLSWDLSGPLVIETARVRLRAVPARGLGLALARLEGCALNVRPRRGGEVCALPGRGHRHKLKKLLQDAGIPPWERARLPLLYAGDALAAVSDRWVCEPFAARADEPSVQLIAEPLPQGNANPYEK
jgi:tRNA(Ile)-lysidine synthase